MGCMMKLKPVVCVIDEDERVSIGWRKSIGLDGKLIYFHDYLEFFNTCQIDKEFASSLSCIIIGRHFKSLSVDVVDSQIPKQIRSLGHWPIFLNWQGYITKEEVNEKFDGKLFHRYGVKWQTLRLRIQKYEKKLKFSQSPSKENLVKVYEQKYKEAKFSKPEKCKVLLKNMARNATGLHKKRIENFIMSDMDRGIALLEAIYYRLLANKNRPKGCPSEYINSSPVIAQRMLYDALYG
jgi:hypothetical protein